MKNARKKEVRCFYQNILLNNRRSDHNYAQSPQFTLFPNRRIFKIISYVSITNKLKTYFRAIVIINNRLHENVKQCIAMLAKRNRLNKSKLCFTPIT